MTLTPRAKLITQHLDLSGRGIEYGPLHAALIPKGDSAVSYVDYADRDALRRHYANDTSVDKELIPEIDIVTDGKPVSEFLPDQSLDYVVASHVMEHVPDILGWLESNLRVLRRGGRIALAFPDKRYCFDIKRRSSVVSDIIAAHLEQRTRPSFATLCDHFWNCAKVDAVDCWAAKTTADNAPYLHPRDDILAFLKARVGSDDYTDAHCWVFADHEFREAMLAIRPFSALPYDLISFSLTQRNTLEFYATFERR